MVKFLSKRNIGIITVFLALLFINTWFEICPLHPYERDKDTTADIKLYTLNVFSLGRDYKERQVRIAKSILDENPDIVFLCEFYLNRNKLLDSVLTRTYKSYYKRRTLCAFYSKHDIDSISEVFESLYGKRHSQSVMAHFYKGNDTLSIIGCHLSSSHYHVKEGFFRRKKESDVLYDLINKESYPVIVLGDLNDISGSYTIRRVQQAGLSDAWWEGGCGYGTTFHDGWLRLRIDHILYPKRRLELQNIKVVDSGLSDHRALVASFKKIITES